MMRLACVAALLVGFPVNCASADESGVPEPIKHRLNALREARLTEAKAELKQTLKELRLKGANRQVLAAKRKALEREIKTLEKADRLYLPALNVSALEVGQIGSLADADLKVFQIVDAENLLVEATWTSLTTVNKGGIERGQVQFAQVAKTHQELFWLQLPTKTLVDGEKLVLKEIVEVTGTKQYETPLGSNTVPVVVSVADPTSEKN